MVSGSGSRDINKTLYCTAAGFQWKRSFVWFSDVTITHRITLLQHHCFAVRFIKSQPISASRVFRILWSWKFAQISSAIKLRWWLLSCEFQFILVPLIIFSSLWTQWQWLETEQLSCRRLEEILSCLIIKSRICTSNASSPLFRALLISIDQMGLVTRDCFKQSPQKTQVS